MIRYLNIKINSHWFLEAKEISFWLNNGYLRYHLRYTKWTAMDQTICLVSAVSSKCTEPEVSTIFSIHYVECVVEAGEIFCILNQYKWDVYSLEYYTITDTYLLVINRCYNYDLILEHYGKCHVLLKKITQ